MQRLKEPGTPLNKNVWLWTSILDSPTSLYLVRTFRRPRCRSKRAYYLIHVSQAARRTVVSLRYNHSHQILDLMKAKPCNDDRQIIPAVDEMLRFQRRFPYLIPWILSSYEPLLAPDLNRRPHWLQYLDTRPQQAASA